MPIYEYQCTACGHKHEALQKFSDEPLTLCPNCQQEALTKLISAAGFQLKGSGWYATDYRDKAKPAATKKDDSSESASKDTQKDVKSTDSGSSNTGNSTSG